MNFKVNMHGVVALLLIVVIIFATALFGSTAKAIYAIIALVLYAFFVFSLIVYREDRAEDKRLIVSRYDEFQTFRTLIGAHLFAAFVILGLALPGEIVILLPYLAVAIIAGFGIPVIVIQRSEDASRK
jgi:amino acid transporter